jgi:YVTN family beta-propeller protein
MKFRSLMTAICVLATANIVSAAPFAYVANSGTKNVSVIDTATNTITATVALPDTQLTIHPYAYGVAIGASGQYVYVGLQDTNEVVVIDAARNVVVKRIGLGTDSPGGLAVNTAETRLYVASNKSNTLIVIDITGSGAAEVGRVTVNDAAISNPEGVVLSTDGLKAYVANSTKGSIAEISLDETNNVYTRTTLIPLVNNAEPMGLTINSTGTKLYAASLNGTASMIDTASRAVTDLPVAVGNISVAITPDNSKIYAPSNSLDKIYVIDGVANTVSATTYAATPGPYSGSVTPDGAKLFLTMNTVSAGNTVQVFTTANLSTAPVVIDLTATAGAGAKPTSMGDFIGPVFPYTITSTNGANCNILPLGAIPVNSYGRTFTSTPTTGTCQVKVDGVSVGQPSSYTFSNVAANHTIDSSPIAGTFYTLSGDWISSIGGWLVSAPAGISKLSKSASFLSGSTVTLSVGDSVNHQVMSGSWTGDCAGSGATCTLTMTGAKTFGATVIAKILGTGPIYNLTKSTYHQTLAEATAAASTNDVIKISSAYITGGSTTGTAGVTVTLSGNWDSGFTAQSGSVSMGALTITNVGVIANNLVI